MQRRAVGVARVPFHAPVEEGHGARIGTAAEDGDAALCVFPSDRWFFAHPRRGVGITTGPTDLVGVGWRTDTGTIFWCPVYVAQPAAALHLLAFVDVRLVLTYRPAERSRA